MVLLKIKPSNLTMKYFLVISIFFICLSTNAQDPRFDICPLKVGTEVPTATLKNKVGQDQDLKTLIGEQPTILVFYRGAWCGYCIKHLAELNDAKQEIEDLGYQIFGITIDQSSKLEISNEKSESLIDVYSDASLDATKAFGLDWQVGDETFNKYKTEYKLDLEEWSGEDHHKLPVPAVYIVKEGKVLFQYVNPQHNTRLKAETLLAILKTL